MKKTLLPLLIIVLLLLSCNLFKEQQSVRDKAISLIERDYPISGQNIEYSQVDSMQDSMYTIMAVYIDNNGIAKYDSFVLNSDKTTITYDENYSGVISKELYDQLLIDGKVFTDDYKSDIDRMRALGIDIFDSFDIDDQSEDDATVDEEINEDDEAEEGALAKDPKEFIPSSCEFYSQEEGDLNKDGVKDRVIFIRNTDPDNFVYDRMSDTIVNRNRRGIIIAFYDPKSEMYELKYKNNTFFESDSEDGGVYFAPELYYNIGRGNLYFTYTQGRYGSETYVFRFSNNNFELIGYENNPGSLQYGKIYYSIYFLTKKAEITIYDDREEEPEPMYPAKTRRTDFHIDKLYRLSEGDVDSLSEYVVSVISSLKYD